MNTCATLLLALVPIAALAGCVASSVKGERAAAPRADRDDYRLEVGNARSLAGCRYDYRVYQPTRLDAEGDPGVNAGVDREANDSTDAPVTVMLGHGFLRDQDRLVGHARALANAGFRVVTLDFCNMRPWNGHHVRNAADLRALATRVTGAGSGVVYAGFSAGALAALIAGGDDPATLGVVTLDLVDQDDLARDALATLTAPLIGLEGPPSGCNANGSGRRVFDTRSDAILETLDGASHCEFESPTNRLCEIACGDEDTDRENERLRQDIVRRVVAAVRHLVGATTIGAASDARNPARE